MKGHIRPRGKDGKTWEIVIYTGRDPQTGKPDYKYHTFHGSKPDAEKERVRLAHELNTGAYVAPTHETVRSFLLYWLTTSTVSGKTKQEYEKIIRTHVLPILGNIKLSKLRPLDIQKYYNTKLTEGRIRKPKEEPEKKEDKESKNIKKKEFNPGLSAQTVKHHHTLLHKAFKDAVRWQIINRNPCDSVDPPRVVRKEMDVYTADELKQLIAASEGTFLYLPVLLAISTGMRRGEITALRWDNVDWENNTISIMEALEYTREGVSVKDTKNKSSYRNIYIPEEVMNILRWHKSNSTSEHVCTNKDGGRLSPATVTHCFPELLERKGLRHIRYHDLRHSHGTYLAMMGVPAKVIQQRLGHSTITTTMDIYGHVLPEMGKDASDKIGKLFG